jgi:methylase of polypeptide subunit release factors
MSIGTSGRVVIEIEPDLKQELHAALRQDGLNLKSWFLENAHNFLSERGQLSLALDDQQEEGVAQ